MNGSYLAVSLVLIIAIALSGCISSSDQADNSNSAPQINDSANPNPADISPQGMMHNHTGNGTRLGNWTGQGNMTGNWSGMHNRTGNFTGNRTMNWTRGERPPGNWTNNSPPAN